MNPFRWVAVILISLGVVGAISFPFYYWGSGSPKQVANNPPPPQHVAMAVDLGGGTKALVIDNKVTVVRDPNTNEGCPGPSEIEDLDEQGKEFNPKGCPFYAKGTGAVIFTGMFIGEIERDISGPFSLGAQVITYARSKHGTIKWKYTRCEGAKKDMKKDGCA
jgi:hypothetical protein